MRIKRLKIRNIASIERGEIDFENGLIDKETGLPASLFLITGNTGSGKSVILDCISMALFATTPRVKSVNGIKNNVFSNNNGELISVNDICQYTRIGISWKDDCYAELSFTGNDDIEYKARFTLGITKFGNHQKPKWTLHIGNSEVIENQKEEIKERIQKAVGLSFEQFSRMAMLAQGQFAVFLTGRKEERERILEQLTATDIFSRYGEAISTIFRRSKLELEASRKMFEEFSKNILEDHVRKELISEQSEKIVLAKSLQTESDELRKKISATEAIKKAENDILTYSEAAKKLKEIENTVDFRKRIAILTLWDSTTKERELLSDKIKANNNIASEQKKLQYLKTELVFLDEDLNHRKERAQQTTQTLKKNQEWIEKQTPLKELYQNSSAVTAVIQRFISIGNEIIQKKDESAKSKEEINRIVDDISHLKEATKKKETQIKDLQEQLARKSSDRDNLNPSTLRSEQNRLLSRQFAMSDLDARLSALETERKEIERAQKLIEDIKAELSLLSTDAKKNSEEYEHIEKERIAAESRYRTMMMSVKKNFEAIRRQLVEEHASNCPLCGQSIKGHIHEWSKENYFSSILTPLLDEKNRLSEEASASKKKLDEIKDKMHNASGRLKAKEEDLLQRSSKIEVAQKELDALMTSLEIKPADNLRSFILEEINRLKKEIGSLSKQLDRVENIQKTIDSLLDLQSSLNKDLKAEEKKLNKAMESLAQKEAIHKSAIERTAELIREKETLNNEISTQLKDYASVWTDSPDTIASQLNKDAETYFSAVEKYSKDENEHRILLNYLDSISEVKRKLTELLEKSESLELKSRPEDYSNLKIDKIQEKWHNLHIEVSSTLSKIEESKLKVSELENQLKSYFEKSGKSETTLRQLLNSADEISEMRITQNAHQQAVDKNETLLAEAEKIKIENLKALNLKDVSGMEDVEKLKETLQTFVGQLTELSQRLGAIEEKLEADQKTRLKVERQKAELELKTERMEKWHKMNKYFGGTRFRNLVQSHILRPLLHNANIYLRQITDHYTLTCSDDNEQLSVLVLDRYYNNEPRSATVLSGGERFMVSLALSLALSAMNRPDLNVDILFIDEGFGTLDAKSLDMVMSTLRRLPKINGHTGRRVGVISHREELAEQIDCQIQLQSFGEGRSKIIIP